MRNKSFGYPNHFPEDVRKILLNIPLSKPEDIETVMLKNAQNAQFGDNDADPVKNAEGSKSENDAAADAEEKKNTVKIGEIFRDKLAWIKYSSYFSVEQIGAANAMALCKTPALGTYVDYCPNCKKVINIRYYSCNNRNCPNCQYPQQERWIQMRKNEVIAGVPYFHIVATLPHELNPIIEQNKEATLKLLFKASAQAVIEMCNDPKRLGAKPGIVSVLHTWTQELLPHYHVHMICSAGGLNSEGKFVALYNLYNRQPTNEESSAKESREKNESEEKKEPDCEQSSSNSVSNAVTEFRAEEAEIQEEIGKKSTPPAGAQANSNDSAKAKDKLFFLPKDALMNLFRGKYMAGLRELWEKGKLNLTGDLSELQDPRDWSNFCHDLASKQWIGFIARTFEENYGNAIDYLARYTFRTAISNSRIIDYDGEYVTFTVRDNDNPGEKNTKRLNVYEFISRFLTHILPKGFTRVRFFGILANGKKTENLREIYRQLRFLEYKPSKLQTMNVHELLMELFHKDDSSCCPFCGAELVIYKTEDLLASSVKKMMADLMRKQKQKRKRKRTAPAKSAAAKTA